MKTVTDATIILACHTDMALVAQLCQFQDVDSGLFADWRAGNNYPFLLLLNDDVVGFAAVSLDVEQREFVVQEFFILPEYRHRGLGRQLAFALFDRFYGRWRVYFSAKNRPAFRFWRKMIQQFRSREYPDQSVIDFIDDTYLSTRENCTLSFSRQLPAEFQPFAMPPLVDGELALQLAEVHAPGPQRQLLPCYDFKIEYQGKWVGNINLRVGNTLDILLYFGHIGYGILPEYRGQHFAERACRLLLPLVQAHGISPLWITTTPDNHASRRTCERLGGRLVETLPLPVIFEANAGGKQSKCRYRIDL